MAQARNSRVGAMYLSHSFLNTSTSLSGRPASHRSTSKGQLTSELFKHSRPTDDSVWGLRFSNDSIYNESQDQYLSTPVKFDTIRCPHTSQLAVRALRIIYPGIRYHEAMKMANLRIILQRRSSLCQRLFKQMLNILVTTCTAPLPSPDPLWTPSKFPMVKLNILKIVLL